MWYHYADAAGNVLVLERWLDFHELTVDGSAMGPWFDSTGFDDERIQRRSTSEGLDAARRGRECECESSRT